MHAFLAILVLILVLVLAFIAFLKTCIFLRQRFQKVFWFPPARIGIIFSVVVVVSISIVVLVFSLSAVFILFLVIIIILILCFAIGFPESLFPLWRVDIHGTC